MLVRSIIGSTVLYFYLHVNLSRHFAKVGSSLNCTPLCKLIEVSNEYKLNSESFIFYLVVGYKTSHVQAH